MSRKFAAKVITANSLITGEVVYLTAEDRWSPDLTEAEVIEDEAHGTIRLMEAEARQHEVVGVYMAEVAPTSKGPAPVHFRERFRARGPSNRWHGKQTRTAPPSAGP